MVLRADTVEFLDAIIASVLPRCVTFVAAAECSRLVRIISRIDRGKIDRERATIPTSEIELITQISPGCLSIGIQKCPIGRHVPGSRAHNSRRIVFRTDRGLIVSPYPDSGGQRPPVAITMSLL